MAKNSTPEDALRRANSEAQAQEQTAASGIPENFTAEEWTRVTGQPMPEEQTQSAEPQAPATTVTRETQQARPQVTTPASKTQTTNQPSPLSAPLQSTPLTAEERDQAELAAIRAAYDSQEKTFADIIADISRDNESKMREDKAVEDAYRKRASWAGAAEAASALVNLIGTTAGATSQTHPHKTDTWMAEADKQAELRRSRADTMRQQLRSAQTALAQQKGKGALAVAQQTSTLARQRTAERKADAQIAYQNARTEAVYQKQVLDQIKSDLAEAQYALKEAKTDADISLIRARIADLTKKQRNAERELSIKEQDAARKRNESETDAPTTPAPSRGSILSEFEN